MGLRTRSFVDGVHPYVTPFNKSASEYVANDGSGNDTDGFRIIAHQDFMGCVVSVLSGDITAARAEASVTTPSTDFKIDGPGVDALVHATAGPKLHQELLNWWPEGGRVKLVYPTDSHDLPNNNHVFHAVGPDYRLAIAANDFQVTFQTELDPRLTYLNALMVCRPYSLGTIVLPLISFGEYNFPPDKACDIALKTIRDFLAGPGQDDKVYRIIIMIPDDDTTYSERIYNDKFVEYFPKPLQNPAETDLDSESDIVDSEPDILAGPDSDPESGRVSIANSNTDSDSNSEPDVEVVTSPSGATTLRGEPCKIPVTRTAGTPRYCPRHTRVRSQAPSSRISSSPESESSSSNGDDSDADSDLASINSSSSSNDSHKDDDGNDGESNGTERDTDSSSSHNDKTSDEGYNAGPSSEGDISSSSPTSSPSDEGGSDGHSPCPRRRRGRGRPRTCRVCNICPICKGWWVIDDKPRRERCGAPTVSYKTKRPCRRQMLRLRGKPKYCYQHKHLK